jgi:hypothetical protein
MRRVPHAGARALGLTIVGLLALACARPALHAQQVPDSAFVPPVPRPAWAPGAGPVLCLDEGHHNFHTLDARFLAFGRLAARDGLAVRPLRAAFTAAALAPCRLLVIANAQPSDAPWERYPVPTPSAFTAGEIAAVHAWVAGGGALLLLADHQPLAGAAAALGAAFGFAFSNGFAVPRFTTAAGRDSAIAAPTLFRPGDGTLAAHPVVAGRDAAERVTLVRSFTGQAFRATAADAEPLLRLPADYVSLEPRVPWQFPDTLAQRPVGGWLQGATRTVGRGRVAVFGEAALFSAQVQGPARRPMGMNAPQAEQNAQFVLNVLHWLAGVLAGGSGRAVSGGP